MLNPMIKTLAVKDWYFIRWPMLAYLLVGLIATVLFANESTIVAHLGMVLIISTICVISAQLIFATVVGERKNQTLAFVMSLPVSHKEYVSSKMIVNFFGYFIPWLAISAGVLLAINLSDFRADGLIPFATIILLELFASHVLVLAIAMAFELEIMVIIGTTICNIFISIFIFFISSFSELHQHFQSDSVVWNATSITIVTIELAVITLLIALIYYAESKKKDFI